MIEPAPGLPHAAPAKGVPGAAVSGARPRAVLGASVPLLVLVAIAFIDVPICPMKVGFGVPCPGCGLTRATVAFLTLDFATMWEMHPLMPVLTPVLGWALLRPILVAAGLLERDRLDLLRRVPRLVWAAVLVAMMALWVVRLNGGLGGHPDGVDPSQGLVVRAVSGLFGG